MSNFIFDVDGTLINSYPPIIDQIQRTLKVFNVSYSYDFIYDYLLNTSSVDFFNFAIKENHLSEDEVKKVYKNTPQDLKTITLMPNVKETLKSLKERGDKLFIYTHRGDTLSFILKELEINEYFTEAVGSSYGFKRKPSGEGLAYLVNKHSLKKNDTFYVGDRDIDLRSSEDANIGSIFYKVNDIKITVKPTYVIEDFLDLINLKLN